MDRQCVISAAVLFLFLWAGGEAFAERAEGEQSAAGELIQKGLTPETEALLCSLSRQSLRSAAREYLLREKEYTRFDRVLTFLERQDFGIDVLRLVYPKLLLERQERKFRIRIFRSIVRILPEMARDFLEAELDRRDSKILDEILMLYSRYRDQGAVKRAVEFLFRDDTVYAAVEALGKMGGRDSIPHLIRKMGDTGSELRQNIGFALAAITGYEFGSRKDVWSLWWKKYGEDFEVKRFLRDFRKVHAVRDYVPFDMSLVSFFLESVRDEAVGDWEPALNADSYIQRIIANPRAWRGVLFVLRGQIKECEKIPEERCSLVRIVLSRYPLCHMITPAPVSREGEHGVFRAVFYKLRRGMHSKQPLLIFVGRQMRPQGSSEEVIRQLIRDFGSRDHDVRKTSREKILAERKQAVPHLIQVITADTDPVIKSTALLVLAEIDPERSLPFIEIYIVSDNILLQACAEMALADIFERNPSSGTPSERE
jgi:hypothetical protein